jgi:hypothetical protein
MAATTNALSTILIGDKVVRSLKGPPLLSDSSLGFLRLADCQEWQEPYRKTSNCQIISEKWGGSMDRKINYFFVSS